MNLNSKHRVKLNPHRSLKADSTAPRDESLPTSNPHNGPAIDGAHLMRMAELLSRIAHGGGELRRDPTTGIARWISFVPVRASVFADAICVHDPNRMATRLTWDRSGFLDQLNHGYLPLMLLAHYPEGVAIDIELCRASEAYMDATCAELDAGTPQLRLVFPQRLGLIVGVPQLPSRVSCRAAMPMTGKMRRAAADSSKILEYALLQVASSFLGFDGERAVSFVRQILDLCRFRVWREGGWSDFAAIEDRDVVHCELK